MKEEIVVISLLVLPALYLSGFFFAVRQILNGTQRAAVKALLIASSFHSVSISTKVNVITVCGRIV